MTRFLFIRHGETDSNRQQRFQGQIDVPLNTNGRVQAARLAERLAATPADALYTSDLNRARQTAAALAAVQALAERHADGTVAVVTHGGVLDMLYRHVAGLPVSAPREFGIPNAGLNRLEVAASGWQIREWAVTAHLDGALDDLPG